jgi:hypothetical protein
MSFGPVPGLGEVLFYRRSSVKKVGFDPNQTKREL